MRELIGELRELTRLDLDPAAVVERFDLAQAARDAVGRFTQSAADARVTLTGPDGSLPVETDRRLRRDDPGEPHPERAGGHAGRRPRVRRCAGRGGIGAPDGCGHRHRDRRGALDAHLRPPLPDRRLRVRANRAARGSASRSSRSSSRRWVAPSRSKALPVTAPRSRSESRPSPHERCPHPSVRSETRGVNREGGWMEDRPGTRQRLGPDRGEGRVHRR